LTEEPTPGEVRVLRNPLVDIETDIRALILKQGKLQYELTELEKRREKDAKKTLLDIIEVADAFELTLRNIEGKAESPDPRAKDWLGHFRSVYRMLMRALKASGVTPIEIQVGEKANPFWHNVVEVVEQAGREEEAIVDVIKKGYLWQGQLLRAAEVKAVKNQ
jgi:molecular chaperone GrpE